MDKMNAPIDKYKFVTSFWKNLGQYLINSNKSKFNDATFTYKLILHKMFS